MYCSICGKEFSHKSVDSRENECPFCGNLLQNDKSQETELSLSNAIRQVMEEFGEDIILQKSRFLSILGDIVPELKKERKILSVAMNEDIAELFLKCSLNDREAHIINAKRKLNGILSEGAIELVVASFALAFGWEYKIDKKVVSGLDVDNSRTTSGEQKSEKIHPISNEKRKKADNNICQNINPPVNKYHSIPHKNTTVVPTPTVNNSEINFKAVALLFIGTIIIGGVAGFFLSGNGKEKDFLNTSSYISSNSLYDSETDTFPVEDIMEKTESELLLSIFKSGFSLGSYYSGAITREGSLYTWGLNDNGQLGDGTNENKSTPSKIMDNAAFVTFGKDFGATITTDGVLYTWGKNDCGQLGDGTTANRNSPVKIMDNVSSIVLGESNCAAVSFDGSLYTWGYNGRGNLGDGTTTNLLTPTKIMDNVVCVYLNSSSSAAITTDNTLYVWGANDYGQIGDGTKDDKSSPTKVLDQVKSASLGGTISAAIKTDGSLYTWGSNAFGMLGNNSLDSAAKPQKIMDNVSFVEIGRHQCVATTANGDLYMWGKNSFSAIEGMTDFSKIPYRVMGNVVSVSLGDWHCAAITDDSTLYTWGTNDYGQLGDETTEYSYQPTAVLDDVISVEVGVDYTEAITTSGYLYSWGRNEYGQLGNGTTEDKLKPSRIAFNE